jgi:anti-sigma-K factor RskA
MSDAERRESRRDELAAYLLGALEPGEEAALERHLEECPDCRAELRWLRPAVQLLPESVPPVEPSPELRARLLAEVEADAARPAPAAAPARRGRRLFSGWRPVAGLASLALIAAVAGYAIGGSSGSSPGTSPKSTTVAAGVSPGVTVRLISTGESGTLHLANVDRLPPNRVLEAWVQRGSVVTPVHALFVPDREGRATTTIPDVHGADAVMVTAEPRGGSSAPTTPPMVTLEMPQ